MSSVQSRRLLINVLLLAVVGVLVALVFYQRNKGADRHASTLYEAAIGDEATRLLIRNANLEKPLELIKQDDKWLIKIETGEEKTANQTVNQTINQAKVQQFFTLLGEQYPESYEPTDELLERFGLMESKLGIQFNDVEYIFGDINPVSFKRYVRIMVKNANHKVDKIVLVSEAMSHELEAAPDSLKIKESLIKPLSSDSDAEAK